MRNRNKKSECLYLLSTDCSLSDAEIVRIYGNRWSIECFFKAAKSFMKLGTEFQSRSYDAMVSHTTIVFTRYILLEWIRRNQNDQKTYGELFFMFCEDIQDMDLTNALQMLSRLVDEPDLCEALIDKESIVVPDIEECCKGKIHTKERSVKRIWNYLLKRRKVQFSVQNIVSCYKVLGMSEELTDYLREEAENIRNLPNAETLPTELKEMV